MPPFEVTCPEEGCQQSFNDEGSLQIHMEKNHPCPWTLPCQFCPEEFNNRHTLTYHLRTSHRETLGHPFKWEVADCAWTFLSQELLDQHSESNHGKPSGSQDLTTYNLRKQHSESYHEHLGNIKAGQDLTPYNLRKSSKIKINQEPNDTESISEESSSNGSEKNKPKKKKNLSKTGEFPCSKCDKVFSTAKSLNKHVNCVHAEEEIKCPEPGCFKVFKKAFYLRNHQKAIHQTHLKFRCQFCETEFKARDYLLRHLRLFHRDSKGYSFKCEVEGCGLAFSSQFYLDKHSKDHKEEWEPTGDPTTRKCPKCHKIFLKASIREHMIVHKELRERSLVCQVEGCGKSYLTKRDLHKHIAYGHEEPQDDIVYICKLCSKSFEKRKKFLRHRQRTCNDPSKYKKQRPRAEKTLKCSKCPKTFGYKESLARHPKKHNEDEKQEIILSDFGTGGSAPFQKLDFGQLSNDIHLGEVDIDVKMELDFNDEVTDPPKTPSQELLDKQSEKSHGQSSRDQGLTQCNLRKSSRIQVYRGSNGHIQEKIDSKNSLYAESGSDQESVREILSSSGSYPETNDKRGSITSLEKKMANERRKDASKTGKFPCSKCDKILSSASSHKKHEDFVHSKQMIKCPAQGCSKEFKNALYLKNHNEYIHQTHLKYPCKFCDSKFKAREYLRSHMRKYHRDKQDYKYKCNEPGCGLSFSTKFFLDKHEEGHREGISPTGDANTLKCPKCQKILLKCNFKKHLEIHLKDRERSFKCEVEGCDKDYYNRRELVVHVKLIHEPPQPGAEYVCKYCEKRFDKRRPYLRHRLRTCKDPPKKESTNNGNNRKISKDSETSAEERIHDDDALERTKSTPVTFPIQIKPDPDECDENQTSAYILLGEIDIGIKREED